MQFEHRIDRGSWLALAVVVGALASKPGAQQTVVIDTVDRNGQHLDGAIYDGAFVPAPLTRPVVPGQSVSVLALWGRLSSLSASFSLTPAAGTTLVVDARSLALIDSFPSAEARIWVSFDPVPLVIDAVDPSGAGLPGDAYDYSAFRATPLQSVEPDGGVFSNLVIRWGNLARATLIANPTVNKDATVLIDSLDGSLYPGAAPSSGTARIAAVFHPIPVVIDSIDPGGAHLVGDTWHSGFFATPYSTEEPIGGVFTNLIIRRVNLATATLITNVSPIARDTTVWIDSLTGTSSSGTPPPPGTARIAGVFHPVEVTIDVADAAGNQLAGEVFNGAYVATPFTTQEAEGAQFSNLVTRWRGMPHIYNPRVRGGTRRAEHALTLAQTITPAENPLHMELVSVFGPIADAGADRSIHAGDAAILDGTGSFDDDLPTSLLGYAWTIVSTPPGSAAFLSGADTSAPELVTDLEGEYVVALVVTDEDGVVSAPDTVSVASTNLPPVADAGPDQALRARSLVTLDGSASSDPEEDALSYSWTLAAIPSGSDAILQEPTSPHPYFFADRPGSYVVELVVEDGLEPSLADETRITVVGPDRRDPGRLRHSSAPTRLVELVNTLPGLSSLAPGPREAIARRLAVVLDELGSERDHRAWRLLGEAADFVARLSRASASPALSELEWLRSALEGTLLEMRGRVEGSFRGVGEE